MAAARSACAPFGLASMTPAGESIDRRSGRFFDSYDRFYRSSPNGWKRQRLNDRYDVLFGDRPSPLCGKVVLDLGSHDGRWSFAALSCGATKVVGVEGSERLIGRATDNMRSYGVPPERYEFVRADA